MTKYDVIHIPDGDRMSSDGEDLLYDTEEEAQADIDYNSDLFGLNPNDFRVEAVEV